MPPEEVSFEPDVYLLRKERARALRQPAEPEQGAPSLQPPTTPPPEPAIAPSPPQPAGPASVMLTISGAVPPESWNRFGSRLIPKLRSGQQVHIQVDLSCRLEAPAAASTEAEIRQLIEDLGLTGHVRVDTSR